MADKVYNLASLDELAGGDQDFVNSMVETFLEHTPGQLEEIKSAFAAGDLVTVGNVAHKIKPNIDLFGIEAIREDIRAVEQLGKAGDNSAELREAIAAVDKELQIAFDQLRAR